LAHEDARALRRLEAEGGVVPKGGQFECENAHGLIAAAA